MEGRVGVRPGVGIADRSGLSGRATGSKPGIRRVAVRAAGFGGEPPTALGTACGSILKPFLKSLSAPCRATHSDPLPAARLCALID